MSFSPAHNLHTSATWDSGNLDLAAYLQRIGYQGPLQPTLDTLTALQRAHLDTIVFENLDVISGAGINIELTRVQEKLVAQRRGGYCHEHNTLFAAVLERLGFSVGGRSARILMGAHEEEMTPVGHTMLNVNLNGNRWLVDVGVGNVGPRGPIKMEAGNEVEHDGWRYRLDRVAHYWVLRYWRETGWFNIYQFSDEPYYRVDFDHHNYYVSTHEDSQFRQHLIVQYNGAGIRYALTDVQLKTFIPGKPVQERVVSVEELPGILKELFHLNIPNTSAIVGNISLNKPREL